MKRQSLMSIAVIAVTTAAAHANDSTINQINTGNIATVDQTAGVQGRSDVTQSGNGNDALVTQGDSAVSPTPLQPLNDAVILQTGDNESATVTQTHTGGSTDANTATIEQLETNGTNIAGITQTGEGNTATARQGPAVCTRPNCDGNDPRDVTNNSSTIIQTGDQNTAETRQIFEANGGQDNTATVLQSGDLNNALIRQGNGVGGGGASFDQGNTASVAQFGIDNEAITRQHGDDSLATTLQTGSFNFARTIQRNGSDNEANVSQNGSDNDSFVEQRAGSNMSTADVSQTGANNFSDVTQSGFGQTATVNQ